MHLPVCQSNIVYDICDPIIYDLLILYTLDSNWMCVGTSLFHIHLFSWQKKVDLSLAYCSYYGVMMAYGGLQQV